jgi:hypothetical protein
MMRCRICKKEGYVDGRAECPSCAQLDNFEADELRGMIARLKIALKDAINRPMGVVPESAEEFYTSK